MLAPPWPQAIAPPPPSAEPLPESTVVALADGTVLDARRHLLRGGSPYRLLRLSPQAEACCRTWRQPSALGPSLAERRLARRLVAAGLAEVVAPAPGPAPTMAVIIPTFGRAAAVAGLLEQLQGKGFDLIVVDDAGPEAEQLAAACAATGATYQRRAQTGGPSVARLDGAALTSAEICCFVDSDLEVTSTVLLALAAHFSDPLLGAVAPRVLATAGSAPDWLARYEVSASPLDLGPARAEVSARTKVAYVPSACLAVRRDLARCFDPSLVVGEDVDLVWRLRAAGWVVRYDPGLTVGHPTRPTLAGLLAQRVHYGSSAAVLGRRHRAEAVALEVSGWSGGAWLAAVTGQLPAALLVVATSVALLDRRLRSRLEAPARLALEVAGLGTLRSGPPLARQVVRTFGPAIVVAALCSRRARRTAVVLAALAWLPAAIRSRSRLHPLATLALEAADDLAYGVGVAKGSWRHKTLAAYRVEVVWRSRRFEPGPPR